MSLAAAIIILIMSIAHLVYGEKKQIPELKTRTSDSIQIGSLRIMIYQGGIILMAVGVVQLLMSLEMITLTGISAYFPFGLVLLNVATSFLIAALLHREIFKITVPQFVLFGVVLVLQYLSIS